MSPIFWVDGTGSADTVGIDSTSSDIGLVEAVVGPIQVHLVVGEVVVHLLLLWV